MLDLFRNVTLMAAYLVDFFNLLFLILTELFIVIAKHDPLLNAVHIYVLLAGDA